MMKFGLVSVGALALAALLGNAPTALADSATATCEVRKEGETRKGASGPCTFSQRQGHINLDLRNGDSYSLTPTGTQGQYRDQKGIKVTRTVSASTQEFRWEGGKKILVTYTDGAGSASYAPAPATGGAAGTRNDEFGTVCGVIVGRKTYRYRCSATDVYSGNQKVTTILRYPDQTIELAWKPGNRVGLQFEGMVPKEARYATSEGETNFVFEGKTYFYYSDRGLARMGLQNFRE